MEILGYMHIMKELNLGKGTKFDVKKTLSRDECPRITWKGDGNKGHNGAALGGCPPCFALGMCFYSGFFTVYRVSVPGLVLIGLWCKKGSEGRGKHTSHLKFEHCS